MLNSMWHYMKNFFQRSRGEKMDEKRKTVVFTVVTSVTFTEEIAWQKDVRQIRKILKEEIGKCHNMKVLKIDSKEG